MLPLFKSCRKFNRRIIVGSRVVASKLKVIALQKAVKTKKNIVQNNKKR